MGGVWSITPRKDSSASSTASRVTDDASAGADDGAVGVIGVGDDAQPDAGAVALPGVEQVFDDARRPAEADDEDAFRRRVERAGVADAFDAGVPSHEGDDVEGGPSRRLVDVQDAVHGQEEGFSCSVTSSSSSRTWAPCSSESSRRKLSSGVATQRQPVPDLAPQKPGGRFAGRAAPLRGLLRCP